MWKRIFVVISTTLPIIGSEPQYACSADNPPEPNPVLEAKLAIDRRVVQPGETLNLEGILKNVGPMALRLPHSDSERQFARVHLYITTPDAETFHYEPHADHPLRNSFAVVTPRSFSVKVAPGDEHNVFRKSLRLTDGFAAWSSGQHPRGPLSLRKPGEYKVWFEYRVPIVDGAPEDAWSGTARSNPIVVIVAESQEPVLKQEPAAEQLAAIEKLQSVAPTSIEGRDILQLAMLRAENDSLAERLVDLCLKDSRRSNDFISMLMWRACDPESERRPDSRMQLGIDGSYLKTAALAVVKAYENPAQDPNHLRVCRSTYGINLAIAYFRFHPENNELRQRFVKLAQAGAQLPPPLPPSPNKFEGDSETSKLPIPSAWQVLLELDMLYAGMTDAEAIEILGPPTAQNKAGLIWRVDTPRHVNPGLSAALKGNQIVSFRRFSG